MLIKSEKHKKRKNILPDVCGIKNAFYICTRLSKEI
jgi:hypothetical protein